MVKSVVAPDYTRMRKAQLIEKLGDLEREIARLVQTGPAETIAGGVANDSESRFRDFAEIASDWFWETDEHLRFTYKGLFMATDQPFYPLISCSQLPVGFLSTLDPEFRFKLVRKSSRE